MPLILRMFTNFAVCHCHSSDISYIQRSNSACRDRHTVNRLLVSSATRLSGGPYRNQWPGGCGCCGECIMAIDQQGDREQEQPVGGTQNRDAGLPTHAPWAGTRYRIHSAGRSASSARPVVVEAMTSRFEKPSPRWPYSIITPFLECRTRSGILVRRGADGPAEMRVSAGFDGNQLVEKPASELRLTGPRACPGGNRSGVLIRLPYWQQRRVRLP